MFRSTGIWKEARRVSRRNLKDDPLHRLALVIFYIGVAKSQHSLFWSEMLNIKFGRIKPWTVDQYILLGEEILHMWGEIPVWNPFHTEPTTPHETVKSIDRFEARLNLSEVMEHFLRVDQK